MNPEFGPEKKKETVRISKKDLLRILAENEQMALQIAGLQSELAAVIDENLILKGEKFPSVEEDLLDPFPTYEPPTRDPEPHIYPSFPRQDIYFDGSNK